MTGLFDQDVLEAAINVALDNPDLIPDLLKANGTSLEDVGMCDQYQLLLQVLQAAHTKAEPPNRDLMASHLAETTSRTDRGYWKDLLDHMKARGTRDAFPLFVERLSALRFRRSLVDIAQSAQNGHKNSDLIQRFEIARLDLDASATAGPLPALDLSAAPPSAPEPLVGDNRQQLLIPGEATAIASDPGVGKTKLLTDLGLGIASGTEAVGFKCCKQPVVYVTSDGDPELHRNLCRQWASRGQEAGPLNELSLWVTVNDSFLLADPACYGQLAKSLERAGAGAGPVTCLIESLATNVLEPEDLTDQVLTRRFVNSTVRRLMRSFPGLTVVMSCHLKKMQAGAPNDLGTRVAGSIQIRGAFDCVIGLVPAGRDAFTVRRVKRSRSGGDFEAFKVQIVGDRTGPLSLRNDGAVNISKDELHCAAKAVMEFMRRVGGPKTVEEITAGVNGFGKRAIQGASKRLSEADKPLLVRISQKPATYDLAPESPDQDLGGLD